MTITTFKHAFSSILTKRLKQSTSNIEGVPSALDTGNNTRKRQTERKWQKSLVLLFKDHALAHSHARSHIEHVVLPASMSVKCLRMTL